MKSLLRAGLLLTLAFHVAAQKPPQAAIEASRNEVRALMTAQQAPGMSVAVAVDGKVVWSEGVGSADLEQQVPATAATRYRLGSVSKLFTAAIAQRLAARGVIDLDAPIQRYVPSFPEKQAAVTLRQLLGHTSGVRHYRGTDPIFAGKKYASLAEGMAIFQDDPLVAAPGAAYTYTSYGYNLIGVALEKATGKTFGQLLQEEVTGPLAIPSVVLDDNAAIVPNRTAFYDRAKETDPPRNAAENDSSYKWPSGGIVASAEDLVRFASAYLQPGFVDRKMLDVIFTPQTLTDGKPTNVGLGWRIDKTEDGTVYYHHGGTITGGRAFLLVLPKERVAVALLANLLIRYDQKDALAIAKRFTGHP